MLEEKQEEGSDFIDFLIIFFGGIPINIRDGRQRTEAENAVAVQ